MTEFVKFIASATFSAVAVAGALFGLIAALASNSSRSQPGSSKSRKAATRQAEQGSGAVVAR